MASRTTTTLLYSCTAGALCPTSRSKTLDGLLLQNLDLLELTNGVLGYYPIRVDAVVLPVLPLPALIQSKTGTLCIRIRTANAVC